jgi:hypothetical protein
MLVSAVVIGAPWGSECRLIKELMKKTTITEKFDDNEGRAVERITVIEEDITPGVVYPLWPAPASPYMPPVMPQPLWSPPYTQPVITCGDYGTRTVIATTNLVS